MWLEISNHNNVMIVSGLTIILFLTSLTSAELQHRLFNRKCGSDVTRSGAVSKSATLSSSRRCAEKCASNDDCTAFNFVKTVPSQPAGLCQSLDNVASDSNCDSAVSTTGGSYYEDSQIFACANGGTLMGATCQCPGSWVGPRCERIARDCSELFDDGKTHTDEFSVWQIQPDGAAVPFDVYCYMFYGGWTMFQRRPENLESHCPGRENFYRNWADYKNGFGEFGCDFWLGNDKIHLITKQKKYKLDVVMTPDTPTYTYYQGLYEYFEVADEASDYRVTIGAHETITHTTQIGDSLSPAGHPELNMNNSRFSTYDRDNDEGSGQCADTFESGWWFNDCTGANVNGIYSLTGGARDTSVPSIMWKYDWDTTGVKRIDLKLLALS